MNKKSNEFIKLLQQRKARILENLTEELQFNVEQKRTHALAFGELVKSFGQVNDFKDVGFKITTLGSMRAFHVQPKESSDKVILYFHGGAFMYGLDHLHVLYEYFSSALASEVKAQVFVVDYSLAPENKFPRALNEVYAAYVELLEKGFKPENICVAGDSAGGNLSLALLLKLRDMEISLPACAIIISPWADLTRTVKSYRTREDIDPFDIPEMHQVYVNMYLGGHDEKDPYASPLYGNFKGLPPLMILVGGREIIYDDAICVAEKAKKAGVKVNLEVKEDMMHIYPVLGGIFKEGKAATKRISDFIHTCMG